MITAELFSMLSSALFWGMFGLFVAIPYGMYLVAYIFEGRRIGRGLDNVPLWRDQSKAFMPGDIGLALFLAVGAYYANLGVNPGWSSARWYLAVCVGFSVIVFVSARVFFYRPEDYTPTAWGSPSKVYHDYVMYGFFTFLLAYVAVPVYFATQWHADVVCRLLGLLGLSIWILGMVYDLVYDEVPNQRQHPTRYQPIWRQSSRSVSSE